VRWRPSQPWQAWVPDLRIWVRAGLFGRGFYRRRSQALGITLALRREVDDPFGGTLFPAPLLTLSSMPERAMSTILLLILVLLLIGALPTWPYSSGWGYYPSGGLGLVVIILLVLVLLGRV
jgi:hypothetical protein